MPMQEIRPGVWQLRVAKKFDPLTGRYGRVVRNVTGTKREATKALAALTMEVEHGTVASATATLNDAIERFLEVARIEPTTRQGYGSKWKLAKDSIGKTRLADLTAMDLTRFYAKLQSEGQSPSSIRQLHAIIRSSCKTAVNETGWLAHNPAVHARLPRLERREIEPPTPEEVDRLIATAEAEDPGFALMLELLAAMGGRRGEVVALRRSDMTEEDDGGVLLTIRHAAYQVAGGPVQLKDPKSHQRRHVRSSPEMGRALRAHLARQAMAANALGVTLAADPFIFPNPRDVTCGRPMTPTTVTRRFVALWNRANPGTKARLHDLRHYHATELVAAGVPLTVIQKRLGHSNVAVTSIYTHGRDEADRAAALAFEDRQRRRRTAQ